MNKQQKRGEKLAVRKIREVLRHHFDLKLSNEKVAFCTKVSKGSVNNLLNRFKKSGLEYSSIEKLKDIDLVNKLYPKTNLKDKHSDCWPDFDKIRDELSKPHTTR